MLLNIKVLLLTKLLLSYSKIQAVQLAVHGNKLAVQIGIGSAFALLSVHLHCFATT